MTKPTWRRRWSSCTSPSSSSSPSSFLPCSTLPVLLPFGSTSGKGKRRDAGRWRRAHQHHHVQCTLFIYRLGGRQPGSYVHLCWFFLVNKIGITINTINWRIGEIWLLIRKLWIGLRRLNKLWNSYTSMPSNAWHKHARSISSAGALFIMIIRVFHWSLLNGLCVMYIIAVKINEKQNKTSLFGIFTSYRYICTSRAKKSSSH